MGAPAIEVLLRVRMQDPGRAEGTHHQDPRGTKRRLEGVGESLVGHPESQIVSMPRRRSPSFATGQLIVPQPEFPPACCPANFLLFLRLTAT